MALSGKDNPARHNFCLGAGRRLLSKSPFLVPVAREDLLRRHIVLLGIISSMLLATPASADLVVIDTSLSPLRPSLENQGWWPPTLGFSNFEESDVYFTGRPVGSETDTEVRSFFSFFIDPALIRDAAITSAAFIVRRGMARGDTAQETLGIFDVTSPIGVVMHNVSSNVAVWTDLGTGTSYGTYTFDVTGDPDANLYIPLNGAALAAIQTSVGDYFTFGAAITSGEGFVFGGSSAFGTQALALQTSVSEPQTVMLLLLSLAGFLYGPKHRARNLPGTSFRVPQ